MIKPQINVGQYHSFLAKVWKTPKDCWDDVPFISEEIEIENTDLILTVYAINLQCVMSKRIGAWRLGWILCEPKYMDCLDKSTRLQSFHDESIISSKTSYDDGDALMPQSSVDEYINMQSIVIHNCILVLSKSVSRNNIYPAIDLEQMEEKIIEDKKKKTHTLLWEKFKTCDMSEKEKTLQDLFNIASEKEVAEFLLSAVRKLHIRMLENKDD